MRKSIILDELKKYDAGKGLWRSLSGDHSSIVALRSFCNSLLENKESKEERKLTPEELIQLGIILLKEKPTDAKQLSHKIYSNLIEEFGEHRLKALKVLHEHGFATPAMFRGIRIDRFSKDSADKLAGKLKGLGTVITLAKENFNPLSEEVLLAILNCEMCWYIFNEKDLTNLKALISAAKAIFLTGVQNKIGLINLYIKSYNECFRYSHGKLGEYDFAALFQLIFMMQNEQQLVFNLNNLFSLLPKSPEIYEPKRMTGRLLEGLEKLKESKCAENVDLLFKDPMRADEIAEVLCCLSQNGLLDTSLKTTLLQVPDQAFYHAARTIQVLHDMYEIGDQPWGSNLSLVRPMFTRENVQQVCKMFANLKNAKDIPFFFATLEYTLLIFQQNNLDLIVKNIRCLDKYIFNLDKILELWANHVVGTYYHVTCRREQEQIKYWKKLRDSNATAPGAQLIFDSLLKAILEDFSKEAKESKLDDPQHSLEHQLQGIFDTLQELKQAKNLTIDTFQLIYNHRKYAKEIAAVLKQLNRRSLCTPQNYGLICQNGVYCYSLVKVFEQLDTKEYKVRGNKIGSLLDQKNLDTIMLMPTRAAIVQNSLKSLGSCLLLNQHTFDLIWQNPEHHKVIAEAIVLLETSSVVHQPTDFLNIEVLKAISENPSKAIEIARNMDLVVKSLKAATLNNENNLKLGFEFAGFCQLGNELNSLHEQKQLNQESFDEVIRQLRKKQMEALCMGTHPRLGLESSLYGFFGRNHPIGDRKVFGIVKELLNSHPPVLLPGAVGNDSKEEESDDDESNTPQAVP